MSGYTYYYMWKLRLFFLSEMICCDFNCTKIIIKFLFHLLDDLLFLFCFILNYFYIDEKKHLNEFSFFLVSLNNIKYFNDGHNKNNESKYKPSLILSYREYYLNFINIENDWVLPSSHIKLMKFNRKSSGMINGIYTQKFINTIMWAFYFVNYGVQKCHLWKRMKHHK